MKKLAYLLKIIGASLTLIYPFGHKTVASDDSLMRENKISLKVLTEVITDTSAEKVKDIKDRATGKNLELENLRKNNEELRKILLERSQIPFIWKMNSPILTGKVYTGTLLNSIVSTNLASPLIVKAHEDQGLPPETYFTCQGNTQHKRVHAFCNKMIANKKEVAVITQLLNLDGTSGLIGDYEDGKEELMVGAVLGGVATGAFSVAQDRLATPFGEVRQANLKNQILQGGVRGAEVITDLMVDELKRTEPVVTIHAGMEVIIYFQEAINE